MSLIKKYVFVIIGCIMLFVCICICNIYALNNDSSTIKTNFQNRIAVMDRIQNYNDTLTNFELDRLIKEEHLAINETKELITIHINKIDNDYTLITIWAAILSIIFLVFSFFSIYKIEETKKGMDNILKDFNESVTKHSAEIEQKLSTLEGQAVAFDEAINRINDRCENLISEENKKYKKQSADFTSEFNKLIGDFQNTIVDINTNIESIKEASEQVQTDAIQARSHIAQTRDEFAKTNTELDKLRRNVLKSKKLFQEIEKGIKDKDAK